ncbi:DNA-binding protein [Bosea sp. (in: a-proteobacteria)]
MTDNRLAVKTRFEEEGVSVAEWARSRGFSPKLVYRVLDGSAKGTRGEAHRIACALGLKSEPSELRFRQADAA